MSFYWYVKSRILVAPKHHLIQDQSLSGFNILKSLKSTPISSPNYKCIQHTSFSSSLNIMLPLKIIYVAVIFPSPCLWPNILWLQRALKYLQRPFLGSVPVKQSHIFRFIVFYCTFVTWLSFTISYAPDLVLGNKHVWNFLGKSFSHKQSNNSVFRGKMHKVR